MKRQAVLIGNTGGLDGISLDLERTTDFLTSPQGGEWYASEIVSFIDPAKSDVVAELKRIKRTQPDYLFFLFSGHGYHGRETTLHLNETETLEESELNFLSSRQLSIFDCCRVSPHLIVANESASYDLQSYQESTRDRFDARIMQAASQHVRLYACSEEESALQTENGALYLTCLLDAAESLNSEFMTVEHAHSIARPRVIRFAHKNGEKQTPTSIQPKLTPSRQLILSIQ
ncbi:caspase family protein [Achromobacter xylosoxidans]|uniref:caspase family protein n=1 Tax=Alcaligenes xylosoxydans xylosoxydans TaxID=85698 RepID=UPI0009F2A448|nr:caspase family protein [Achromobacter xylosoxidans]MCZ8438767.1 caspase family protein [Achromobacter xylosoxidans]